MVNRQTIRGKIFHLVLSGVLLFSLGAVVLLPQPVSAASEQALSFDRINDYVQTTNKGIIPTTNFTIEAWIGGDEMGYQDIVTQWKSGTAGRFEFGLDSFNKLVVCVGGAGVAGANTAVGSGWHYIVVTYADDGTIIFYLDGAADGGGTYAQGIEQDTPLRLGTYSSGSWLGRTLDEVRISNTV